MSDIEQDLGPVVTAKLVGSERITPDSTDEVRKITISIDDPAFRYQVGQSLDLLVPGPHDFGNKYHVRRYTIAAGRDLDDTVELEFLVRRCFYLDEVSGERYPGIASNYLCDAQIGAELYFSGPYRNPFSAPADPSANLLMIGTGTGIAPFRGFAQQIAKKHADWQGQVRLFYGAKSGMENLYANDPSEDLINYYDESTFKAFKALTHRPLTDETGGLADSLGEHAAEAWELLQQPNTYVYLAGLEKTTAAMDAAMSKAAGTGEIWEVTKARLREDGRWTEMLYS